MKDDKKQSILKEALIDANEIKEAATVIAKNKLAKEFPDKLNELLKEELQNKNKTKKESYKKIDKEKESDKSDDNLKENEESVMEKKETKKVAPKGSDGDTKPFNKTAKKVENIEEVVGDGKPFDKKANKSLQTEEFNITELDVNSVGTALENADEDDELLTMEEIEAEINNMENLEGELDSEEPESDEPEEEFEKETVEDILKDLENIKAKLENIVNADQLSVDNDVDSEEELDGEMDGETETDNEISDEDLDEGIFGKNLEELDVNDPKDQKTIADKFYNTFNTSINQFSQIKNAVKGIGFDKMLELLIQNKSMGAEGGALGIGSAGLTIRPKKVSFAGKGRSRLGEENNVQQDLNEILGFSIGEKFKSLDPNDEANVIKLFNAAFGDILMNPKMGEINRVASKTSIPEKYELLKQYVQNNGGTLRTSGGKLVFAPKQLKDTSTSFAAKGRNRLGEEENMDYSQNDDQSLSDEDIDAILSSNEDDNVDEAHGVSYGERRKMTGRHNPSPEYLSTMEADQLPDALKESKVKVKSLIEENKKLTKKFNENKKLVEAYKGALEKYRQQLKDMSVFNSNLAYVNNLFVNESLALTQQDKIKIINDFKKVDSITESQKMYKNVLAEMKGNNKTISESLEKKVVTSIQPSSKQKIDEVIEKTAYKDSEHINKMLKLIDYGQKKR